MHELLVARVALGPLALGKLLLEVRGFVAAALVLVGLVRKLGVLEQLVLSSLALFLFDAELVRLGLVLVGVHN